MCMACQCQCACRSYYNCKQILHVCAKSMVSFKWTAQQHTGCRTMLPMQRAARRTWTAAAVAAAYTGQED